MFLSFSLTSESLHDVSCVVLLRLSLPSATSETKTIDSSLQTNFVSTVVRVYDQFEAQSEDVQIRSLPARHSPPPYCYTSHCCLRSSCLIVLLIHKLKINTTNVSSNNDFVAGDLIFALPPFNNVSSIAMHLYHQSWRCHRYSVYTANSVVNIFGSTPRLSSSAPEFV